MDGACRPQLHSHNNIINLKAMESPKATYDRSRKSERMSLNPTFQLVDSVRDRLLADICAP
jgi:hypothetical protein